MGTKAAIAGIMTPRLAPSCNSLAASQTLRSIDTRHAKVYGRFVNPNVRGIMPMEITCAMTDELNSMILIGKVRCISCLRVFL